MVLHGEKILRLVDVYFGIITSFVGRRILLNWSHNHMVSSAIKSMSHKRDGRQIRDEEYLDQTGNANEMNVTVGSESIHYHFYLMQ